ncbi:MAG: ATP-binding protein [Nitrospirota bacterium]
MEIEADSGKFNQIMFNLLSNAIKFTPAGGSVSVQARFLEVEKMRSYEDMKRQDTQLLNFLTSQLPDRNFIEISVEDTGIGIKPEDIPRLFKEITQLESPYTKKKYSGAGIGLMLTKKLVELHDGKIWVESEYGKGSTFRFVIPCKVKQPSEPIVDPVTKLLTWERALAHMERVFSFHKRRGLPFGLLRIEITCMDKPEEHVSIVKMLKNVIRKHEILSYCKVRGCYYLILFYADRQMTDDTVLRITAILKEAGYDPVIRSAVYMQDGENIEELLGALNE